MLDIYDEYMNYVGCEDRDFVHEDGLWHKTVHCWLYDNSGNIYFQIRANSGKLYTTASGHVLAGETIKQAFSREVMEEIGVSVEITKAEPVEINVWKMDKMKDGKLFKDRAFANVYLNVIDQNYQNYKFDENEVLGVVRVNAQECLNLFLNKTTKINAHRITQTKHEDITLTVNDFLVQGGEIPIIKYGKILQSVISKQTSAN